MHTFSSTSQQFSTLHSSSRVWEVQWFCVFTNTHHFSLFIFSHFNRSLVAQSVKNAPAMWETWVWSLGWEDPLEEGMATHSSILAWRIPMDRGAWWPTAHGAEKSQTRLSGQPQQHRATSCGLNYHSPKSLLFCEVFSQIISSTFLY